MCVFAAPAPGPEQLDTLCYCAAAQLLTARPRTPLSAPCRYAPAPLVALSSQVAGPDRCEQLSTHSAWQSWAPPCNPSALLAQPSSCIKERHSAELSIRCCPPPHPARRPNLQWPRASFDAKRRAGANAALLQGWTLGMAPAAAAAASTRR